MRLQNEKYIKKLTEKTPLENNKDLSWDGTFIGYISPGQCISIREIDSNKNINDLVRINTKKYTKKPIKKDISNHIQYNTSKKKKFKSISKSSVNKREEDEDSSPLSEENINKILNMSLFFEKEEEEEEEIKIIKKNIRKYIKFIWNGEIVKCEYKIYKDKTLYILDEIKPFFGLDKIGTHSAKFNGKDIVLYRPRKKSKYKLYNLDVVDKKYLTEEIKTKIKRLIILKNILGVKNNVEKTIRLYVREEKINNISKTVITPLSYSDLTIKSEYTESTISNNTFEKWFSDGTYNKNIFSVLDSDRNNLLEKCMIIKQNIVEVIERIDRTMISFADYCMLRLFHIYDSPLTDLENY